MPGTGIPRRGLVLAVLVLLIVAAGIAIVAAEEQSGDAISDPAAPALPGDSGTQTGTLSTPGTTEIVTPVETTVIPTVEITSVPTTEPPPEGSSSGSTVNQSEQGAPNGDTSLSLPTQETAASDGNSTANQTEPQNTGGTNLEIPTGSPVDIRNSTPVEGNTTPSNLPEVQNTTQENPQINQTILEDPLSVNQTILLSGNVTEELALNETNATGFDNPDNETFIDPPLNTTAGGSYYKLLTGGNGHWVIDQAGYYYLDVANSTKNVDKTTGTFYNFGSSNSQTTYAIWIKVSDVILDGMDAILNGGGKTDYGIMVDSGTSKTLSGISISNLTITGFTEAGIWFDDVLGGSSHVPQSNITDVVVTANIGDNYWNPDAYGIELTDSRDVNISNSVVTNNGNAGVYLSNSSWITVTGDTIRGNDEGILLKTNSRYNTLSANTITRNNDGISLMAGSRYVNVSGNTVADNWEYGIILSDSDYNLISGNTIRHNYDGGMYLSDGSDRNNITNNIVDNNQDSGIFLSDSDYNQLSGNNITNNQEFGIYLSKSDNNNITGNWILNNGEHFDDYGIYLHNSQDNKIYNNYFNNRQNVGYHDASSHDGNTWNITKTPGTNIVGGSYLGGNYWATPQGDGWSETHADRGDGFANEPYVINSRYGYTDYLPLVIPAIQEPAPSYLINTNLTDNRLYTYDGFNGFWVINESSHTWTFDLSALNNTVNYDPATHTFSNFGPGFALLINASNVIIDGMGAILDGKGMTGYGIIVNNQTIGNYNGDSLGGLGGISITNPDYQGVH